MDTLEEAATSLTKVNQETHYDFANRTLTAKQANE